METRVKLVENVVPIYDSCKLLATTFSKALAQLNASMKVFLVLC